MASSSREFVFDVFLSFGREDSRDGFAGHLYEALTEKGINTFLDSEKLHKETSKDELFRVIERSEIFIPVFSERYADSRWCLREMAKITECGRLMLPIFFDVDPSDVRKQTGPFQHAFSVHEKSEHLAEVDEWKKALEKAGNIPGHAYEGNETKLIQFVVKDVLSNLKRAPLDAARHPIGIGRRVKDVMKLLNMDAQDVRMVGVHGMGGIGKTTISMAIYNRINRKFSGASFIFNIAERSKQPDGLVDLQKQLISDLFHDDISSINIYSPEQGISMIRSRVATKKILLVLDDVDQESQLESLAGEGAWFYPGSRVLITTRDYSLLIKHDLRSHETYGVKELDESESLQLFSYHAFGRSQPPQEYFELSKEVVQTAGGLPLALEVHGSYFFDLTKMEEWEEMLGRLRRASHDDVQQKLKVSYDGLTEEEKCIFLDIACFFVGKRKEDAMQMWQNPNLSIKALVHKSLVKINSKNGDFEMHDVIRDLGRNIVRQESPEDPWLRSRLWDRDDILHVLQNPKEICSHVEGIILNSCTASLRTDALSKMPKLRLLQINHAQLDGDFLNLPKELMCLELIWCQLPCLMEVIPDSERPREVTLKYSGVLGMDFRMLRVLNLSNCGYLTLTPDFSGTPCLVRLTLDCCVRLMEVHVSIKHLKLLKFWSMRSCGCLKELPPEVSALISLETLNLSFCFSLETLPERLGDMKALEILLLDHTRVKELPDSVTQLEKLRELSLKECGLLVKLPELIGKLVSLKNLAIAGTRIKDIPNSIGEIANLETVDATSCKSLSTLPESIGRLKNLRCLKLGDTCIRELPDSIGFLEELETMLMSGGNLKVMPYSFERLRNLVRLEIPGPVFSNCPENFQNLKNLMVLNLSCDWKPSTSCFISDLDFENLPSLKSLTLDGNYFDLLSPSISKLSQLVEFSICWCKGISYLPQLPSSLTSLCASDCSSLTVAWDISNLKHLRKLDLSGCKRLLKIYGHQHLESLEQIDLRGCWQLEPALDITCEKEEEELQWSYVSNPKELTKLQEEEELQWSYISNRYGLGFKPTKLHEEELQWFYVSSGYGPKLIIKVPFCEWMPSSLRSIGVLIYAMVGQEVIFESPRMADEWTEETMERNCTSICDSNFDLYAINIWRHDELFEYIGDAGTSLHVRLGLQDLRTRHSERTMFMQLKQLHIASRSFSDSEGEEGKIFFTFLIPKSPTTNSQVYIREVVLRIKEVHVKKRLSRKFHTFIKVMVEGVLVFETRKVCDKIKASKEDEDSRYKARISCWRIKFGDDDEIHKVLGSAPTAALLHVSTSAPDDVTSRWLTSHLWADISVQYSPLDYWDEA